MEALEFVGDDSGRLSKEEEVKKSPIKVSGIVLGVGKVVVGEVYRFNPPQSEDRGGIRYGELLGMVSSSFW